ncbi:hypothetical protein [Vibrio paracholerae]|uniref:hypothetical protein n=1 Tax=Vibrio paracholerae TaxID=650003 RepID=UPI0012B59D2C|nr:hypothetical protein [Vibrio paracholerae]
MYLFSGALFYLIIPAWIRVNDIYSFFSVSDSIVKNAVWLSVYYWGVIFITYIFSKSSVSDFSVLVLRPKQHKLLELLLFIFLFISSLYILLTSLKAIPAINTVGRVNKIEFYYMVTNSPGFMIISWMLILYTVFISLQKRNRWYLVFQISLVFLDIITSGREYILTFLLSYIVTSAYLKKKIPLLLVFTSFVLLILVSVLRSITKESGAVSLMSWLINGFGEFIFTWETSLAVLNVGYISDENVLITILFRMLPSGFTSAFGDIQVNYQDALARIYNADFGLGSSILTEGLVKGTFFSILHPLFLCIYFSFSNMLNRTRCLLSRIYCFLSILSIYSVFRGSFYISLGENHYVLFFYLYPLIFLFLMMWRRKNER